MAEFEGKDAYPEGYFFGSSHAGLKQNANDVLLIYSCKPANFACVFTKNSFPAAPVVVSRKIAESSKKVSGIVANSGCANAATGKKGIEDAQEMVRVAMEATKSEYPFLVASTGVIGSKLPVEKVRKAIMECPSTFSIPGEEAAKAIMTTDSFPKYCITKYSDFSIFGITKGAGMISPEMATTLTFIVTDAYADNEFLKNSLLEAVEKTYNRISVDGDMSTNDCIYLIANGVSGTKLSGETAERFQKSLENSLMKLAMMIVKDGEGATKVIRVLAKGFYRREDARSVAKSIGDSLLVKTAIHGEDANWGRVLAAAGKTCLPFDDEKVTISFGDIVLFKGEALKYDERKVKEYLKGNEITIIFDAGQGVEEYEYITCDLSEEYVRINARYRS